MRRTSHSLPFVLRQLAVSTAALATLACAGGTGEAGGDGGPPAFVPDGGGLGGAGGNGGFEPSGGVPAPPGGNHRPELVRIGDREAEVGVPLEIQLEGTDPDGDAVTFNVRSSLPDGAKFEKETGRFTWTPEAGQLGTLVLLTFEIADPEKLRDQETIQITVVGAGMGSGGVPVLDPIGDQSVPTGRPFELQLVASDPNGDALTFSMRGAEALVGASLDAEKGLFSWTPEAATAGQTFKVTFVVSDGEHEVTAQVSLVVREANATGDQDLPPRIDALEDREIRVGETIDIVVTAKDERPEALTYELVTPPPEGSSFDAQHAHFVWTHTADQVDRAYRLVFRVSDGTYRAIETLTLTVINGMGGGTGSCSNDPGEPNLDERTPLTPDTPVSASLCPAGDADSYVLNLAAGDAFDLQVQFAHADGDLDVGLFGPEGSNFEVTSTSSDDDEQLSGTAPVAGAYALVVLGYQDATNPAYSVLAHVTAGGGGGDCAEPNDPAEGPTGNHDAAHAASLRDHLNGPLRICAGDSDFFYVDLEAGQRVTLQTLFQHAQGDLDTVLTGPDGYENSSGSADDDEQHVLDPVPVAGRYVLEVFGYDNAENTYQLSLSEEAAAPCAADRVEPNDTRQDAEPFPPEAYNGLTWCGEPDWYKTQTAAGEALVVYVSYDAASPPRIAATTADGTEIGDTSWEIAEGDGCRPNRQGCRRLTVRPPAPGFVHYQIIDAVRGMPYDLTVRVQAGGAGPMCSMVDPTCSEFEICDYPSGRCEASYCDDGVFACPGDYLCHENWCVELCNDDLTCSRAGFSCKVLDGLETCGLSGEGRVGDGCFDFTDCSGALDCLVDAAVPGGYCSRTCRADADCDGSVCATYGNGRFCAKRCANDGECRDGYVCGARAGDGGAMVRGCEPAP